MTTPTISRLGLSAALGAVIAALVIHAPAARADSGDFLNRVQDLGWYDDRGDAYLLDNGWAVCRAMTQGYTGLQIATQIYRVTDLSVTADDAAEFVIIAVEELCPQFDRRGQGVGAA